MGHTFGAKCKNCGTEFEASEGGGFTFHLLHCDQCGKDKSISFDKLGDLHLRYVKGLDVPYSSFSWELDKSIQRNYPGEPISEADYYKEIEKLIRKCRCGGRYRFDAPPRCPKCRSTDFEQGPMGVLYD
jgi:hypothetical protein